MISSYAMHWDFALILIFLATAVPLLGRRRVRQLMRMHQTTRRDRLALYASTIVFQWIAAGIIVWRANDRQIPFNLLGLAIPSPMLSMIVTVLLAALILANQLVSLRRLATNPSEARGALPQLALKIFPRDATERLVFFALVITVAICEEFIFRGFVQRVFEDWSGGLILAGVLGSAGMFGLAHLYQGRRGIITTFVVGILFSTVRSWTGSLAAPLIAHFVADLTAGLLAPSRLRTALGVEESGALTAKQVEVNR